MQIVAEIIMSTKNYTSDIYLVNKELEVETLHCDIKVLHELWTKCFEQNGKN